MGDSEQNSLPPSLEKFSPILIEEILDAFATDSRDPLVVDRQARRAKRVVRRAMERVADEFGIVLDSPPPHPLLHRVEEAVSQVTHDVRQTMSSAKEEITGEHLKEELANTLEWMKALEPSVSRLERMFSLVNGIRMRGSKGDVRI